MSDRASLSFTFCVGFGSPEGVSKIMGAVCYSDLEIFVSEDSRDFSVNLFGDKRKFEV